MTPVNQLPFQYLMRGQQLQYLDGDAHSHAVDQRDRDLEDFLGQLASPVGPISAAQRWNTAWGVVAMATVGSVFNTATSGWTAMAPILGVEIADGRLYRVRFTSRAWAASGGATAGAVRIGMWDGSWTGEPVIAGFDHYVQNTGQLWAGINVEAIKTFTAGHHDLTMAFANSTGAVSFTIYPTSFYVEDVGPVTRAGG